MIVMATMGLFLIWEKGEGEVIDTYADLNLCWTDLIFTRD